MLCLVFAVAGPVMPGAGDVSPMDPTMAYGAAPNMLVFAPDGGVGFDLGGQDSFVDFLTSWNTTIAGPLGTSRAQNVIPPNPKGPMAVRATSLGRSGGDFDIRMHHSCHNSTSGTRTATGASSQTKRIVAQSGTQRQRDPTAATSTSLRL